MPTLLQVPLNKLIPSPRNVRLKKSSAKSIARLPDSIAAEGLLENLIVVESAAGQYEVIAGERRLAALRVLSVRGTLKAGELIDCKVIPADRAASASLSENHEREAMHPADQCLAFKKVVDEEGLSETQIAARFSVTRAVVRERLALADVAPEVIELFRDDELSMEQVEAFTVTTDHDKQRALLGGTVPGWSEIKRRLTERATANTDPRARFVGERAYKAAGGGVRKDLFGEGAFFEDAGLLEPLALEQLEAHAAPLRDEWSWVEVRTEFAYTERAKFDAVPMVRGEPAAEQAAAIEQLCSRTLQPAKHAGDPQQHKCDRNQGERERTRQGQEGQLCGDTRSSGQCGNEKHGKARWCQAHR